MIKELWRGYVALARHRPFRCDNQLPAATALQPHRYPGMNRTLFSNSHLLENGDIIGRDEAGRTVIQLAADDWLLEQLMALDAGSEGSRTTVSRTKMPSPASHPARATGSTSRHGVTIPQSGTC